MTVQDDATSGVKETGTCQEIDTSLTQDGSLAVLVMAHRDLRRRRDQVGAETAEGRLLSTLMEQIRNYQKETDPAARDRLKWGMSWSVRAIKTLTA